MAGAAATGVGAGVGEGVGTGVGEGVRTGVGEGVGWLAAGVTTGVSGAAA